MFYNFWLNDYDLRVYNIDCMQFSITSYLNDEISMNIINPIRDQLSFFMLLQISLTFKFIGV